MPLILRHQTEAVRERILVAIEHEARAFVIDDEIRVPMPCIVVSCQKPGRAH